MDPILKSQDVANEINKLTQEEAIAICIAHGIETIKILADSKREIGASAQSLRPPPERSPGSQSPALTIPSNVSTAGGSATIAVTTSASETGITRNPQIVTKTVINLPTQLIPADSGTVSTMSTSSGDTPMETVSVSADSSFTAFSN